MIPSVINRIKNILLTRALKSILALLVLAFAIGTTNLAAKPLVFVRAIPVLHEDYVERVALTGEVVSRHRSNLSFLVSGRIASRLVDVGDHVEAGQILAQLDPQEQQADLDAAQAMILAAEAQLLGAQQEFERSQSLLQQGLTPRSRFDQAQTALALAQGALETAGAQLEWAENNLGFTTLIAHESGTITARSAEEGQIIQAAQSVFTLAENGSRDAIFDVYETVLFEQTSFASITISLIELPEVTAQCAIREVSPIVDKFTGTVRVRCGIVDVPAGMTLGSAILGTVQIAPVSSIVLPWTALASDQGVPAVWILDPETQTVDLRRVEVFQYDSEQVILQDGVQDGELIVIDGIKFLRPGMLVEALNS